ncbi:hypothetical protein [Nonomuraea sp. NPDC023979]|uniref:hypothetical protein n=1 Tax=Nonomuraea sp. NPDC023979 TaxID=3154796 RepID=UPI0033F4D010
MTLRAFLAGLFKHPVRTFRERDAEMEAAMELVDAEFEEALRELWAKLRGLAGKPV